MGIYFVLFLHSFVLHEAWHCVCFLLYVLVFSFLGYGCSDVSILLGFLIFFYAFFFIRQNYSQQYTRFLYMCWLEQCAQSTCYLYWPSGTYVSDMSCPSCEHHCGISRCSFGIYGEARDCRDALWGRRPSRSLRKLSQRGKGHPLGDRNRRGPDALSSHPATPDAASALLDSRSTWQIW